MRVVVAALISMALFPCVVALCVVVSVRSTAANPAYVVNVVRELDALSLAKDEFLDGMAANSGLPPADAANLRQALEEGIPVAWLDEQFLSLLTGLAGYLKSEEPRLVLELAVVELKVNLLTAIHDHMGEEYYLEAARGFQSVPDFVDIGVLFDTATLQRIRPLWRNATLAPLALAVAVSALSALLWLAAGKGRRGVAVVGGVWLATGVVVVGGAIALGLLARTVVPSFVPANLGALRAVPLRDLAFTAVAGLRSTLVATGAGAVLAGALALAPVRPRRTDSGG